ncbi:MAG: DNA polymerase III subunit [Candidatus Omnitrophica bacterium]|nr:DNA polymerase III subunit [Candidatus Omnitrophota bacterium]
MSFNNIRGQQQAIEILQRFLAQSTLQGGYLFVGPEGVGKKTAAKTLAKALECQEEGNDSCDRCPSCLKIEKNQHPDVRVIDGSDPHDPSSDPAITGKEIKIEQIRQMQKEISLRPFEGRKKVFIIDNAHTLTAEASSALLKVLEEPPGSSVIILVTDKQAVLLKTILSRCKVVKFSTLPRQELEELFRNDFSLDAASSHYLAYVSEGRIGRALRLKETSFLQEKNRIIDALVYSSGAAGGQLSTENRQVVRNYLTILSTWFRDLYLLKIGMPHAELINRDRKDQLLRTMSGYSFVELNEIFASLSEAVFFLEHNVNVKLLLGELGAKVWKG